MIDKPSTELHKALKKGVVSFDKPQWSGEGLESEIEEDLGMVVEALKYRLLKGDDYAQYEEGELDFGRLRAILKNAGYTDADIARELIGCLKKQSNGFQKQIAELEHEKLKNKYAEEVVIKTSSLPAGDTYEKVIKYEKAVQRSILQNLALLKRLQSTQ
jgi:hypothetical protein